MFSCSNPNVEYAVVVSPDMNAVNPIPSANHPILSQRPDLQAVADKMLEKLNSVTKVEAGKLKAGQWVTTMVVMFVYFMFMARERDATVLLWVAAILSVFTSIWDMKKKVTAHGNNLRVTVSQFPVFFGPNIGTVGVQEVVAPKGSSSTGKKFGYPWGLCARKTFQVIWEVPLGSVGAEAGGVVLDGGVPVVVAIPVANPVAMEPSKAEELVF